MSLDDRRISTKKSNQNKPKTGKTATSKLAKQPKGSVTREKRAHDDVPMKQTKKSKQHKAIKQQQQQQLKEAKRGKGKHRYEEEEDDDDEEIPSDFEL